MARRPGPVADKPGAAPSGEAPVVGRILLVDDERNHAETVAEILQRGGHETTVVTTGQAAVRHLRNHTADVVLTDLKMRDVDGIAVLEAAQRLQPDAVVILITGHGDVKTAVESIRKGAFDFIEKPADLEQLRSRVARALERVQLVRRNRELEQLVDERFGFEGVIGDAPALQRVIDYVKVVAPTSITVLIAGETGTGKELIAKAIHNHSPRRKHRFVAVNCATLEGTLLQSELFGHIRGAFTGADKEREGKFEYASGGTLFLDEIGELPLETQAMLLRVFEERTITRMGANKPIPIDVRLVAATNRDLDASVATGTFRLDLLSRLRQASLRLPSLAERPADVPLLAQHFLRRYAQEFERPHLAGFDPDALRVLQRAPYPGNVRTLQNLVQRLVIFARTDRISAREVQQQLADDPSLPADARSALDLGGLPSVGGPEDGIDLDSLVGYTIDEVERALIRNTLRKYSGNRKQTAEALGIAERTLYRKLPELEASS